MISKELSVLVLRERHWFMQIVFVAVIWWVFDSLWKGVILCLRFNDDQVVLIHQESWTSVVWLLRAPVRLKFFICVVFDIQNRKINSIILGAFKRLIRAWGTDFLWFFFDFEFHMRALHHDIFVIARGHHWWFSCPRQCYEMWSGLLIINIRGIVLIILIIACL